jgi:ABC-type antimicrobial peptide transport system permease subunit
VITEDDIENLKRAKGAIYSAMISLLDKVGKRPSDLRRIYIAGGFGSYINVESAVSIGLLPDIERSLYTYIGNSSLAGARLSLLSREAFLKTLKEYPALESLLDTARLKELMFKNLVAQFRTIVYALIVFAGVIFFGSILNGSLISIAERQREIATFRVLGFEPEEIGSIFLSENMMMMVHCIHNLYLEDLWIPCLLYHL